jgi:hypothetical protein
MSRHEELRRKYVQRGTRGLLNGLAFNTPRRNAFLCKGQLCKPLIDNAAQVAGSCVG